MFRAAECGHSDVQPCRPVGDAGAAGDPVPQIDFGYLRSRARNDTVQLPHGANAAS